MWAEQWGPWFWDYKHASAFSYRGLILTEEEAKQIKIFIIYMCQYLGCPFCKVHALKYIIGDGKNINSHQPDFKTGDEYWDYEFKFHNHVNSNKDKKTLQITNQEAEEALINKFGSNMDIVFNQHFWSVLLFTCLTFSNTPDNVKDVEQTIMKDFLTSACYTLPFSHFVCSDGRTARDKLLEFVKDGVDVKTRDNAMKTITNMQNVLALEFGQPIRTLEENKTIFNNNFFDSKTYALYVRSIEVHKEDQIKLLNFQQRLNENMNTKSEETFQDNNYWYNVSIVLSVVLSFVLLLNVIWVAKILSNRYINVKSNKIS